MKPYSEDLRERIVTAVTGGMKKAQAARFFKVSLNSVKRYVKQWEESGTLEAKPVPGRPPTLDAAKIAVVEAKRAAQPDTTLAEHAEHLYQTTGLSVSPATICRLLARQNITRKKKA